MMKYLFLAIAILLFANNALGCKLALAPITNFNPAEYIFIGDIVEVIESAEFESEGVKASAVGFKVKVTENIYSPKQAAYFEVFPLRLTTTCGLSSDTKKLLEQFPVGSKVRVVAAEATIFKNQPANNSTIRLETSIYNCGTFSRNDLILNLQTSANTLYDYRSFVEKERTTAAEDAMFESNYDLPEFELHKDLFRLREAKSESETTKILERLSFYPHVYNLAFPKIARTYLVSQIQQNRIDALEKQWEQRVQEINSKRR